VISDKAGGFFGVTAVCCGGDTVHYFWLTVYYY
jgi:hypothetical protein